ncbi:MAG: transglycosylase SLT domain-containing protein [Acidobacteria bacterium]|nr:transglycosylase SLT domain-containing protein [Acidobacteriota bacterium]
MEFINTFLRSGKNFGLTALVLFITSVSIQAQITSTTSSGRNNTKPDQVENAEKRIDQIAQDSGRYFKQGLFLMLDRRGTEARQEFDKSVEVFLMSGVNVQRNDKLRECYNQLIETVYRMEFPSPTQPANIRSLSTVCSWNINEELAVNVSKLVQTAPAERSADGLQDSEQNASIEEDEMMVGFSEQKFEPSPLDELSKLQLNDEEINVDTPEAQQEYEYIRVAVERNQSFGFSFQMHRLVQQFINYYRGRGRRTMEVGLYRSGMFMSMARRIFREEGVPENVAWLGQVESAWKPTAASWASASGLWQFIPGTGQRYGLRRTAHLDERQSFEKATRASAQYLKFLANRYGGNWELAIAGYNCGEGNVDKAIRRAGVRNFWAAYPYLPQETRNYVPNILATIIIANNPGAYGFGHIRPARPLAYDRIRVPSSTSLNLIAQASDTNVNYLRYLNPELRSNVTPPEPYIIRIPQGRANGVAAVFKRMPELGNNPARLANSTKGESWENISRRTGVSVEELVAANPGMKAPTGRIVVPVTGNNVQATSYSRPTKPVDPNIRVVKALAGDTVEKLALRYKASPGEVARFNGLLTTSRLNSGREIKIPAK